MFCLRPSVTVCVITEDVIPWGRWDFRAQSGLLNELLATPPHLVILPPRIYFLTCLWMTLWIEADFKCKFGGFVRLQDKHWGKNDTKVVNEQTITVLTGSTQFLPLFGSACISEAAPAWIFPFFQLTGRNHTDAFLPGCLGAFGQLSILCPWTWWIYIDAPLWGFPPTNLAIIIH